MKNLLLKLYGWYQKLYKQQKTGGEAMYYYHKFRKLTRWFPGFNSH